MSREADSPISVSEVLKENGKPFSKKMCLCPEEWRRECNGTIAKAHTVSRTLLEKISIDYRVYGVKKDLGTLVSNNGNFMLKKIGINNASVFTGFCATHDNDIFKPVEKFPFSITNETAFLLAYRALCYEYFTKVSALESIPFMKLMDKGRSPLDQMFLQYMTTTLKKGLEAGQQDQIEIKKHYDKMLIENNYNNIKYYVVKMNTLPSFMSSGCISPSFDFHGNKLQNLANLALRCEAISLSIISDSENCGLIVFAWIGKDGGPCDKFIKSYHQLTNYQKVQSIVRFVFEFLENKYLNIGWWDGLNEKLRIDLSMRQHIGINPTIKRKANCLMDDGNHYVDWDVLETFSNIADN